LQAEEREREESRRLRELERGEQGERRKADLRLRDELAAAMEVKRRRLAHAVWAEREAHIAGFLATTSAPYVLWRPARLCQATRAALAERKGLLAERLSAAEARLEADLGGAFVQADHIVTNVAEEGVTLDGAAAVDTDHAMEEAEDGEILPDPQPADEPPAEPDDRELLEEVPDRPAERDPTGLADILGAG
jgi:hypothetical protein